MLYTMHMLYITFEQHSRRCFTNVRTPISLDMCHCCRRPSWNIAIGADDTAIGGNTRLGGAEKWMLIKYVDLHAQMAEGNANTLGEVGACART